MDIADKCTLCCDRIKLQFYTWKWEKKSITGTGTTTVLVAYIVTVFCLHDNIAPYNFASSFTTMCMFVWYYICNMGVYVFDVPRMYHTKNEECIS